MRLGSVSSPLCVWKVERAYSETQLCQLRCFNPLTPNNHYSGRTAPLTSKRCILYIYSTNTGTEYFKHGIYSHFFPSKCSLFHNSNTFGSCFIHILYTECAKILKNNSGAKRLMAILDNYMFQPLQGTVHPGQFSGLPDNMTPIKMKEQEHTSAPRNFKFDNSHQSLSCLQPEHTTTYRNSLTEVLLKTTWRWPVKAETCSCLV